MTIKFSNKAVTSTTNTIPFWFGTEEPFQVQHVLHVYEQHIKLNSERPENARSPWQFIGKVARKIHSIQPFQTIDSVYVYENRCVCQGRTMPLLKQYCFLTTWCRDDGVPKHFSPSKELLELDDEPTYFLYAFPEFTELPEKRNTFEYRSSKCNLNISHAGNVNLAMAQYERCYKKKDQEEEVQIECFEEDDENDPYAEDAYATDHVGHQDDDDVIVTGTSPTKIQEDYFQALLKPTSPSTKKSSPCTPICMNITYEIQFDNEEQDDGQDEDYDEDEQQYSEDELLCECSSPYFEEQEEDSDEFFTETSRGRGFSRNFVSCKN